ncbi:hypothetical protein [Phocaeicola dorei]|nr:hypothetical protein [Phocaeicola dorei]EDY96181.1 hypothetical protein BACPLE_01489 [Phocaeicola plebeius DSM 17135]EEB27028.1 hypothetical protein BACDOR_00715 [Phocaeicola dorei DSM 17855]EEU52605.1 hypothetical protein HMPREF0619_00177 [Parabacteroides sp. D13]
MTSRMRKTGDARNSFLKDWEVASLCFGCTETACHPPSKLQEVASRRSIQLNQ